MVGRLSLEQYKATIKGLTQFGDRRQGTDRNRAAVDWIEAQLKSYGCAPTERITYDFQPPAPFVRRAGAPRRVADTVHGSGGSRFRGYRMPIGVNTDSLRQPDPTLRALDTPPSVAGERQEVYCTKVGTTHPDEMYIVGGHMDGIGWGDWVAAGAGGGEPGLDVEAAHLTPHEQRILTLIGEGMTNRQIARQTNLAEKTIKNYVSSLLAKLGVESRTQAAILVTRNTR